MSSKQIFSRWLRHMHEFPLPGLLGFLMARMEEDGLMGIAIE